MGYDMGWLMPLTQFNCRTPETSDHQKSLEIVNSWRCDITNYNDVNGFLNGCFATCLNTFCQESVSSSSTVPAIKALEEYFSFLAITDWFNDVDTKCEEDIACWVGEITKFEQAKTMYARTTLEETNIEDSLVYCSNLLNDYQKIVDLD